MSNKMLGVIGGLGSYASSYFYKRLLDKTKATCDQDYIDMILLNHASVPDRTDYLISKEKENPYDYLKNDITTLDNMNVSSILILCNTAYSFYDDLIKLTNIPIRNLISDAVEYLNKNNIKKITLLATTGTLETKLYQNYLSKYDIECEILDNTYQEKLMDMIYKDIKLGKEIDIDSWNSIIGSVKTYPILLGCTELSILKTELNLDDGFVDPVEIEIDLIIKDYGSEING